MQKVFGTPIRFRLVQHSREREWRFKKRPAIQPVEIDRRRLDSIVNLERVRLVTGPRERLPDRRGPLANRQRFPIILLGQRNQSIELSLSFKNGFERKPCFDRERGRAEKKQQKKNSPSPHSADKWMRNLRLINHVVAAGPSRTGIVSGGSSCVTSF